MKITEILRGIARWIIPGAKFSTTHWLKKKVSMVTETGTIYKITSKRLLVPAKKFTGATLSNVAWLEDKSHADIIRNLLNSGINQDHFQRILLIMEAHGLPPEKGRYMAVIFDNANCIKFGKMGIITSRIEDIRIE